MAAMTKPKATLPPKKKRKSKRCDATKLDAIQTPRQLATERGETWNPPQRDSEKKCFIAPGDKWIEENTRKLHLFEALRIQLAKDNLLAPAMTNGDA